MLQVVLLAAALEPKPVAQLDQPVQYVVGSDGLLQKSSKAAANVLAAHEATHVEYGAGHTAEGAHAVPAGGHASEVGHALHEANATWSRAENATEGQASARAPKGREVKSLVEIARAKGGECKGKATDDEETCKEHTEKDACIGEKRGGDSSICEFTEGEAEETGDGDGGDGGKKKFECKAKEEKDKKKCEGKGEDECTKLKKKCDWAEAEASDEDGSEEEDDEGEEKEGKKKKKKEEVGNKNMMLYIGCGCGGLVLLIVIGFCLYKYSRNRAEKKYHAIYDPFGYGQPYEQDPGAYFYDPYGQAQYADPYAQQGYVDPYQQGQYAQQQQYPGGGGYGGKGGY